jgi:hypothetical protein
MVAMLSIKRDVLPSEACLLCDEYGIRLESVALFVFYLVEKTEAGRPSLLTRFAPSGLAAHA